VLKTEFPITPYDDQDEAMEDIEQIKRYTTNTLARAVTLWQQVRYIDQNHIPGDLVECGVQHGAMPALMALAHKRQGLPFRRIHLFDSFQGLPEPDKKNDGDYAVYFAQKLAKKPHEAKGRLIPIEFCVGARATAEHVMGDIAEYPKPLTFYHEGWFEETMAAAAETLAPIAVLRLDCDWYSSTRTCLEYLAPLVVDGGFIIEDDMGHLEGARKAMNEWMTNQPLRPFVHHIDMCARYIQVRR
jgi:hypothetical protein